MKAEQGSSVVFVKLIILKPIFPPLVSVDMSVILI